MRKTKKQHIINEYQIAELPVIQQTTTESTAGVLTKENTLLVKGHDLEHCLKVFEHLKKKKK